MIELYQIHSFRKHLWIYLKHVKKMSSQSLKNAGQIHHILIKSLVLNFVLFSMNPWIIFEKKKKIKIKWWIVFVFRRAVYAESTKITVNTTIKWILYYSFSDFTPFIQNRVNWTKLHNAYKRHNHTEIH